MSAPKVRRVKVDRFHEARKALREILRRARAMTTLPMGLWDLAHSLQVELGAKPPNREDLLRLLTDEVKAGRVRSDGGGWCWVPQAAVAEPEPPAAAIDQPQVEYYVHMRVSARIVDAARGDWGMGPLASVETVIRPHDTEGDELQPLIEGFSRAQLYACKELQRYLQKIGATR